MSDTAAAVQTPTPTGADGAPTQPEAQPPPPQKVRLKGIDGDDEREYEPEHVVGLARRGKEAARLVSLAEKKVQEAKRLEQEANARFERMRSGDMRAIRAALKEMGVDEKALLNNVAEEVLQDERLTPEQRRIRELEGEKRSREEEAQSAKQKEEAQRLEQETAQELDNLANLFQEVMSKTGLPRDSAGAVGYRLAHLYQAADAAGVRVDPDLAAARIRGALQAEHRALFTKKGPDGKEAVDFDVLAQWLGPEAMNQLRKRSVQEYLKSKGGGGQPPPAPPPPQQRPQPRRGDSSPKEPRKGSAEWWRQFDG